MTARDIQTAHATLAGAPASLSECVLTLDRSWSPYIQGTAALNGIHDIDPDALVRFRIRFAQWFATGSTGSELAAEWAPGTGSEIAADMAPRTGSEIAALHMRDLNVDPFPPTWLTADLLVRDVELDLAERVTRLALASDDARLWDAALVSTSPLPFGTTSVREIVATILSLLGVALEPGDADGEVDEPPILQPGTSYRAFLTPLLQKAGLRLYADERRVWRLVDVDYALSGGVTLSTARDVTGARPRIDSETGGYDSVVIEYRWNVDGQVFQAFDVAGPPRPRKTYKVTYDDTPYPGAGAATRLLSRMSRRRRIVPVDAAANYAARPTMNARLSSAVLPQQSGQISRVVFQYPSRTMTLDIFDLETLSPDSTRAIPPSYTTRELPGKTNELNPGGL